jgi:hypothetical protein
MMRTNIRRFISVAGATAIGVTLARVLAQSRSDRPAQTKSGYLPENTASGEPSLPKTNTKEQK